eukprot:TRINITY_DN2851_c0_g1_i1.p1 TRINITY_DN2851_c0_g1~~TRINITY_DN2851_c0_g1_i1.p1  ORF type:complete len:193 (+),score=34.66 TRINITY_DN2851_c0_g1_i1:224-802(+)
MESVLQRIKRHKYANVFYEPVDLATNMDYLAVIKNPMDLGTVERKLNSGEYPTHRMFAEDIRLVFRNALAYNPSQSDVAKMTRVLSDIFEREYEKTIKPKRGRGRPRKSDALLQAAEMEGRMPYEEKLRLATLIRQLPIPILTQVLTIIQQQSTYPHIIEDDETYALNFETMEDQVLWSVFRYLTETTPMEM